MTRGVHIELFPCSGGMTEGFRRAGIELDLAFDIDPDACASHEKNLGIRPVQMDVRDLLRMIGGGWSPGPVELLVADPPCAPWSRAGKRKGTGDERDMLLETCEVIKALRPRVFLIGNIPGLDDMKNWGVVQKTIGAIEGYCVDYKALDAADYGVPQRRTRPFWFGHSSGPCIQWPKPTHADPKDIGHALLGEDRAPWRTCEDALSHLPLEDLGKPARMRKRACNGKQHGSVAKKPARTVGTSNLSDGNVLTHPEARKAPKRPYHNPHPSSVPGEPARTLTTREGRTPHSGGGTLYVEQDGWPWQRPATTVSTRDFLDHPGHHDRKRRNPYTNANCIVLSEKAAAILQGFPEEWHFAGKTKASRWSQIGQAMPPPLAEAVARQIVKQRRASAVQTTTEERAHGP